MKIQAGAARNASGPRPTPYPSMNRPTTSGVIVVPAAPNTNGATGLPNRHRLSPYQSPPLAAAQTRTVSVPLHEAGRRPKSGHRAAAATIPTPGYFAPAATPANTPAAASSGS